jgi:hypothetical protein
LIVAADTAVKTSVNTALKGDLSVKATFGLGCAVSELPKVGDALEEASDRLHENLMASADVSGAIGI